MPQSPRHSRRLVLGRFCVGLGALTLAGCGGGVGGFGTGPMFGEGPQKPSAPPTGQPPLPGGGAFGTGSVKVALVLPVSAGGQSSQIAAQLRNAAELAAKDFQGANIQVSVKDDSGTTEGGQAAASQAIAEGAQLIIGPLNAVAARGVSGPARQAGVPVVTFTTDSSVASRGVYLISFLPATDVERVVAYAASQGKKSFAALIPDDAFGAVAEAAFRQAAAQSGVRVLSIERYRDAGDISAKAQAVAKLGNQIDAVFVPDTASNAALVAQALQAAGIDRNRVRLVGTSRWNEPGAFGNPALAGSWYPAVDPGPIESFRTRYRQAYGTEPGPLAVLGYEAVFLAAGLVRNAGPQPFREEVLLSRNGFLGVTGVFRFKPDGTSERGLAVFELGGGQPRVVSPAPRQFPTGS